MIPIFIEPGEATPFPHPDEADGEGLLAVGGDLSPERLLAAYEQGIFPWFGPDDPPLWWSPDPRTVLPPARLHVARRLRRRLRRPDFELSWNRAFGRVMRACAQNREDGTWITREMLSAYERLHALGHAHSLEVWQDGELTGGIYGVQRGALFAAESMFHTRTGASKIALVACVHSLATAGIELFDVQFKTAHLARMGALEWPRRRYLLELARSRRIAVDLSELAPALPG